MALPGLGPLPPAGASEPASASVTSSPGVVPSGAGHSSASEDPNRKIRKPYTITKSRESWTEQEHDKFLEALQLFDRDWKKIEAFVGSKTVIQIRSHAQKYFLKVQKNGTSEHVPPPRPKRKAAHPYPQKASKNAPISHIMESFQSSPVLLEPGYVLRPDSSSVLGNSRVAVPSQTYNQLPPIKLTNVVKDDNELAQPEAANNYCANSNSESPRTWHSAMPDFAQVYRFIGSVFDPDASDHLQRLKMMDPINLKAAMMLMRNLSVNLITPEFEDHRRLLSSYDVSSHKAKPRGIKNNFHAIKLENAISSA